MKTQRQFLLLFSAIILIVLVIALILSMRNGIPQPSFVYILGTISVPYTGIQLSYIGFILPLLFSIIFFFAYTISPNKIKSKKMYLFIPIIIIIGLLLYFMPSLQIITRGVGSHINYYIFIPTFIFWFLVLMKNKDAALLLSYPIFFLMGAISDLDSMSIFKRAVFGGAFLYDGDFLFPLAFFSLSYCFWLYYNLDLVRLFKMDA
jgi:hypothetical protein